MKKEMFNVNTVFENDTYYTFDKECSDIYLSDTKKAKKKKYMTIASLSNRRGGLDTAFWLHGLKNVTLDFGGAVITLHGKIQPFMIDECENITIKNAVIEYERSFHTEFDIVERNETELHLKVKDRFPCRVENGYFIPYCNDWEIRDLHESGCHFIQAFDSETKAGKGMKVIYLGEEVKLLESPPIANIEHVKVRKDGDTIIFKGTFPEKWEKGTTAVLCHSERDVSSVAMYHSKDVTIENFRIINGAGMGYYAIYTENITLNKIGFFCDDLSHGIVTNDADGVHFVGCKGYVKIYDSRFEGMIDDTLNIHSVYHLTSKVSGNIISAMRTKYSGCLEAIAGLFGIGDTIAVYNGMTMEEKARFVVQNINLTDDRWVTDITVDGNTENIAEGDVIENISTNPSLHFKNTEFINANTHQRLQTRGKSLIENCTYAVPMWLTGDMNYWFESSPIKDLTVRNCTFIGERAIVALRPQFTHTEKAPYYHTGVTIENCVFDNPNALKAKCGDDIKFIGNKSSSGEKLVIDAVDCGNIIEE